MAWYIHADNVMMLDQARHDELPVGQFPPTAGHHDHRYAVATPVADGNLMTVAGNDAVSRHDRRG